MFSNQEKLGEILDQIKSSSTWQDLHQKLRALGVTYEKKGGGAILRDKTGAEVKPSDLARWASLKNLEKKFASLYQPPLATSPSRPRPSSNPSTLATSTNDADDINYTNFQTFAASLRARYVRVVHACLSGLGVDEKDRALAERYMAKMEANRRIQPPKEPFFEAWLAFQSYPPVSFVKDLVFPEITHTIEEKIDFFRLYHAAVKADRYRVTCVGMKDGKPIGLPLDRDENKVSKGYTPDEVMRCIGAFNTNLIRATKHGMGYYEAKGEHVYFTPLSEKKLHFFIDDMSMETLRDLESCGLMPNCIIESSPGNFQAIFTFDRAGFPKEAEIANRLAGGANRIFGDINFSGAIHGHRAPGFYNPKPKYKINGVSFVSRIVYKQPEQCLIFNDFVTYMNGYQSWEKHRKHRKSIKVSSSPARTCMGSDGLGLELFKVHHDNILQIIGVNEDPSRLDFMVATRLRGTGHSQAEVEQIIFASVKREKWDAAGYAQRTAEAAFGFLGDHVLEDLSKWITTWKRLERMALEDSGEDPEGPDSDPEDSGMGMRF